MHCDPVPLDLLVVQVHFALHWVIPLISSKVTSKGWQQICPMQESNSTVSQSVFTFAIIPESGHLPALEADGILFLYRMEFSWFTGDLKKQISNSVKEWISNIFLFLYLLWKYIII